MRKNSLEQNGYVTYYQINILDIFLQATIERLHSNNILSQLVIQKTFFKLKEVENNLFFIFNSYS